MPLIARATKSAFEKNIATERRAGRPIRQAVAIAYSEKRAAGRSHPMAPPHHSSHIEDLGSQYEQHVSMGQSAVAHPGVQMSRVDEKSTK